MHSHSCTELSGAFQRCLTLAVCSNSAQVERNGGGRIDRDQLR